jgi:hypothetical protein
MLERSDTIKNEALEPITFVLVYPLYVYIILQSIQLCLWGSPGYSTAALKRGGKCPDTESCIGWNL